MNGTYEHTAGDETAPPIFDVQKVNLQFDISANFVAAAVANDVLVLALSTGRILRFDLSSPSEIDDIDLPKRATETGVIRKLFLDPSASHLIISTALGDNYYLHAQSRQPKALARLKGVQIECVAWNPARPTASTREILLGSGDGNIIETYIEPSSEFYKREEKYVKSVYNASDGAVVGVHVDLLSSRPDRRQILIATRHRLIQFVGSISKHGTDGSGSIYTKFFEGESPAAYEGDRSSQGTSTIGFTVSPDAASLGVLTADASLSRAYAWLSEQGISSASLVGKTTEDELSDRNLAQGLHTFPKSSIPPSQTPSGRIRKTQAAISAIMLSHFHVLALVENRVVAFNRLDDSIVYDQEVLEPSHASLGLCSDPVKGTYWLFTTTEIFEVVATEESRDVWKIMLKQGKYEAAQQHAKTSEQRDQVAATTGDHLIKQGKYLEAAKALGNSSKPFEDVALTLIDLNEQDALRTYLLTKLASFPKSQVMQRTMLASWLIELYMAKLNQLDDTINAKVELHEDHAANNSQKLLPATRKEYQDFVKKHTSDLDRRTVYEIISSHGRQEELLFFAQAIDDHAYVLEYWVQREHWSEAMSELKRRTEPEIFYRYSTVLMAHSAVDFIEIVMRQTTIEPKKLILALLNYNKILGASLPLKENQAIRFLHFCIDHLHSTEPAVHNTLISLYASNTATDESALLTYLETQSSANEQNYDADFALRLCITNKRVRSAVHIYGTMGQFASAVDLALRYDQVDLAALVADRPANDDILRKKLWLKVAKKVIGQTKGIKDAMEFLKRCKLLRIEDLIPFFPDFVVIDDFKEEICAALESYSHEIESLKAAMDASANTASSIKTSIAALSERYAIVEPGERCWKCRLPLLMRQFFVFPCQHSFHADCLGEMVLNAVGLTKGKRIRELQREVGRAIVGGKRREGMVKELDALVAGACVLCSEMAVRTIDEPFITSKDDPNEWAI